MKYLLVSLLLLSFCKTYSQYVVRVQHQVLFDVVNARASNRVIATQDSLIASLRTSVSSLEGTVSSCLILNTDYQNQISYLKQVNFDNNKEIIILQKEKKRLKRQTFWLKVLIPVAVGATIFLENH